MKFLYIILVCIFFQPVLCARLAALRLDDAVKKSDLIVIGTLTDVKEYTKDGVDHGEGTITVEKLLYGKLPGKENKLTLVWQNRSSIACPRVEHTNRANQKGIWLLQIDKDSKVFARHPQRFQKLEKLEAIAKLLPKPAKTGKSSTEKPSSNKKRIWGIAKVEINDDGSVTLTDILKGKEHGMFFPDDKGGYRISVTLKKGESCEFMDGDHAFNTIKLDKVEKGNITFSIKYKVDARSFGEGVKTSTKTITIKPY